MLLAVTRSRKGPPKVPNSKAQRARGVSQAGASGEPTALPRSRTKTDQDAIYMQVTRAQADVIRAKADRDGKSIKDVLLSGLMDRSELEAECAMMRNTLAEYTRTMKDTQSMLLGASTERALTREEAQVFTAVNKLLVR